MKMRLTALLTGILTAVMLLSGCVDEPVSSSLPDDSALSTQSTSSNETYYLFGMDAAITLINENDELRYDFYSIQNSAYLASLALDTTVWGLDDMDQNLLGTLYERDFNADGLNEFGVPMQNGLVLWYEYIESSGFRFHSTGNADGPDDPFPALVGSGLSPIYSLDNNGFDVRFRYFEDESRVGYYVVDPSGQAVIGALAVEAGPEYADYQLDRFSNEPFTLEDRDGDGTMEIGLLLSNGGLLWFQHDPDLDTFTLYAEEVFAMEEEEAFEILANALGSKMEGYALSARGVQSINGASCCIFAFGSNAPDKFTAEKYFAVDPEGNILVCDPIYGTDYLPYEG